MNLFGSATATLARGPQPRNVRPAPPKVRAFRGMCYLLPMLQAATQVADELDTNYPTARSIVQACRAAYAQGSAGLALTPLGLGTESPTDMIHMAWVDGITRKDRVVLHLESRNCGSWFRGMQPDHADCEDCSGTGKDPCVLITVTAPFADQWADSDQYVAGATWERLDDHQIYAMPVDHPGLVAELRAEGYRLDLSNYETEEP